VTVRLSVPVSGLLTVPLTRRRLGGLVVGGLLGAAVPPALAATQATQTSRSPFTGAVPDFSRLAPGSRQVLLVATDRYGATRAQVSGWRLGSKDLWSQVLGGFDTAWIGARGFAPSGFKHEGDAHSPTGVFPIVTAFGVQRPTGLRLPWLPVRYPYDYWVDDPRSPHYNSHVDRRTSGGTAVGRSNPLPRYPYAAVIGYNTARRVPGAGSAIFLHPTHDSPTLGCVGLPLSQLAAVLRWLDPAQHPRVVMGVGSELLRLAGGRLPRSHPTEPTPPAQPSQPSQPTAPPDPPPTDPAPTDPPPPTGTPGPPLPSLPS